jgi:hypothetical protein
MFPTQMRSKKVSGINFLGRQEFLWAIESCWRPSRLETLAAAVPAVDPWLLTFPAFQPMADESCERLVRRFTLFAPWPFRWNGRVEDLSEVAANARKALENWHSQGPQVRVGPWIMDAAIHSIAWLRIGEIAKLVWAYSPDVDLRRRSRFEIIAPESEQDAINQAKRGWNRLVAEQSRLGLKQKGNISRDALWMARWLAGESDQEIYETIRVQRSAASVERARQRFNQSARITFGEIHGSTGKQVA